MTCHALKTLLLGILFFFTAHAQVSSYSDRVFQRIGLDEGLSEEHVTAISQDSLGFMWFGTANGLCRYDGETMKVYYADPSDSTSLFSSQIQSLFTDSKGNLWIGAGGLQRYDNQMDHFVRYTFANLPGNGRALHFPNVITEDHQQNLWIGTFGSGLFKFDKETEMIEKVDLGLYTKESRIGRIIYSLQIDKADTLWIAASGRQISAIDLKTNRRHDYSLPTSGDVQHLYKDQNGIKWLSSGGALLQQFRWTGQNSAQLKTILVQEEATSPTQFLQEANGRLWLGTIESGILTYDPAAGKGEWNRYEMKNPGALPGNRIEDVFRDRDGNFWIATMNGVSFHSNWRKPFHHFRFNPDDPYSVNDGLITGIHQSAEGDIWVSSLYKGISRFNPAQNSFTRKFEDWQNLWTLGIMVGSDKRIWLAGNPATGLICYDIPNDKVLQLQHNPDDASSIASNDIKDILEDQKGRIWIATNGGGLNLFLSERNAFRRFQFKERNEKSIGSNNALSLVEQADSLLWIGTDKGLSTLNLNTLKISRHNQNLPADSRKAVVNDLIIQSATGNVLAATMEGVTSYNPATGKYSSLSDKLDEPVYGILEGDEGQVWAQQFTSLAILNPERNSVRIYERDDGWIQYGAFEAGWRQALIKLSNGEMLFGGVKGVTRFHPSDVRDNPKPPPVHITGFRLFYEPVTLENNPLLKKGTEVRLLQASVHMTDNLTLNYSQNTFSFEFSALDYAQRSAIQYAYMLEGFHNDWVYPGNQSTATFTNLSPGEYVFRVKASNSDGVWNEVGDSMNILILTPWWQTGWAYAAFILLALGALYLLWRMQTQRFMLNSQLQMRSFEAEKLKELDTLKSRFFANISHEFRTPLTLILGPIDSLQQKQPDTASTEQLGIMKRNALRLQQLINQLLDLSRLESQKMVLQVQPGDLPGFLRGLIMSFASLAEQKKIKLLIDLPPQTKTSSYFDADKLEKIITNLLSNAFKFTPELGTISIKATIDENLKLTVTDSGIGIAPEEQNFIFERFRQVESGLRRGYEGSGIGLSLVKEMVDLYGGKITLESEPGKGATFYVDLPVSRVAFADDVVHEAIIAPVQTEQSAILTSSSENLPPDSQGKTDSTLPLILIVDDHQDVRTFIRRQLEDSYRLIESDNGLSGLEKSYDAIPDLIISDVMMPEMDGYEFCEKLKTDERTSHVPVILLTARAGDEDKLTGLETGADDYLTKPFNSAELLIRVRNLIASRETLRKHFLNDWLKRGEQLPVSSTEAEFLKKLREALDENLANEHFGIDQLADLLGIGKRQLQRKIRALTNETAGSLIRAARLERAKHLLESNAGTVSEIAYDVGFNHLSYFARCYRERFGISPSDVRKNA